MNPTIKIVQLAHQEKKDGTIPILFRITKNRKSTYLKAGYAVKANQFREGLERWVYNHPDATLINAALEKKRSDLMHQVITADIEGRNIEAGELSGKPNSNTMFAAIKSLLEMYESRAMVGAYNRMQTNLQFLKDCWGRDINLSELNKKWVEKYVKYRYNKGNGDSTVKKNLKDLAGVLNNADYKGVNWFSDYAETIHTKPVHRQKLTIEEIKLLEEAPLTGLVSLARDMFLFAFYAHGMRFESVALLENKAIQNGMIEYRMNKGAKIRQIEIHEKLQGIIDKYQGTGKYLFPVIKETPGVWNKKNIVGTANVLMNTNLNRAAVLCGITRHIHFHLARHTFATIGLQKGVSYEILKDALGHSSFDMTKKYLDSLSDRRINEGVRRVWE